MNGIETLGVVMVPHEVGISIFNRIIEAFTKVIDRVCTLCDNIINQKGKKYKNKKQETIGKEVIGCKSYLKMIL